MSKIKTLLVDDEYLALNLLEEFIKNIPGLEIVAKVKSPIHALDVLNSVQIDLMFLDVQMPTLSGNNLLKTLKNPPVTIFTTAYSEYAIEAFDLNAVDYLLKPFSFERFLQAVNKAKEQLKLQNVNTASSAIHSQESQTTSKSERSFYTAKVDGKIVKIFHDDIIYIEGLREYVRFICQSGKYVTLESLKNIEDILPSKQFLRVHKSYIVATGKVLSVVGNLLELKDHKIPISRSKRDEVVELIFGYSKIGNKNSAAPQNFLADD